MNQIYSLEDLFDKRIFRIPDYQRGYSWGNQQLVEFWEDLSNLSRDRFHYTGMISLKRLDKETLQKENWNDEIWLIKQKGYGVYNIVDGQQRLTTCIILINEILNFVKALSDNEGKDYDKVFLNSTRLNEIIEKYLYIVKPDSEEQLKTYKFGYEVDNPSYEYFKNCILNNNMQEGINETFYTLKLYNAKNFFKKAIKEAYEKEGFLGIENIFFKLTQKLMFNLYDIDDDFNVFVAFETMNNRGKRLSTLELLKNRLIYLTTLFDDVSDDVKISTRTKINDTWKEVYGYLGRNKAKALDDDEFLQAHWISYFGYTKTGKESYVDELLNKHFTQKRILKNVKLEDVYTNEESEINPDEEIIVEEKIELNYKGELTIGQIGKYADSLKNMIPYWYIINFPSLSVTVNSEIKEWLAKLNRVGFAYFKPLVMVILTKKDITDKEKEEALRLIERYIFLHFRLSGYFQTFKTTQFYNLAHYLYEGTKTIEDVFDMLREVDPLSANNILMLEMAKNKFTSLFKYKGYYSWNYLKYFLYEYELYLMNEKASQKIFPENLFKKDEKDKVSVEHIYPQNDMKDYWKKRFGKYTEQQKKYLAGSLGNLLPLSLSINIKLQNDSFDEKKEGKDRGYKNGSHSEMQVAKNDEWTPVHILNRGLEMLDFMEKRWDFKFKSKRDKVDLLFLNFLIKKPEEYYKDDIPYEVIEKVDIMPREKSEYTLDFLTEKCAEETKELYRELDKRICEIDDNIQSFYTKYYAGYKIKYNFAEVQFRNNFLQVYLLPSNNVTNEKIEDVPESYNFTLNKRMNIYKVQDIDIVIEYIKETYKK